MSVLTSILPEGAKKYRENNADSVTFLLPENTPDRPRTLTVTRQQANARKNNLGTVKYTFNCHINTRIEVSETVSRVVPVVVKLETSIPVGADDGAILAALASVAPVVNPGNMQEVFELIKVGLLPDGPVSSRSSSEGNL